MHDQNFLTEQIMFMITLSSTALPKTLQDRNKLDMIREKFSSLEVNLKN